MVDSPIDPPSSDSAISFRKGMSYSDYLALDKILDAQHPLSTAHDEILFIIQHQTSELWMKLAIHELSVTCQLIAADNLQPAFKTLSRVSRILEQLNSAWDVLRTMTPSEYTQFRESLGNSSGFQSYQYRLLEFLAGNKNAAMMRSHASDKPVLERLEAARQAPSIYDLTIQVLHRRGFNIDVGVIERDVEGKYPDLATPLVLYCGGGFRSALAADNLQKMGYTNVISMDGGIRDWRGKGYPLEK